MSGDYTMVSVRGRMIGVVEPPEAVEERREVALAAMPGAMVLLTWHETGEPLRVDPLAIDMAYRVQVVEPKPSENDDDKVALLVPRGRDRVREPDQGSDLA